jgi:hypothetical protein
MLCKRKGAEALASTDSEGESARPTPSKKEKPTVSDCDEDDIPLIKPRMPEPRIPDVDDDIRKSGIPDVDDDTPLFPAKGKRKKFRKTIHTTHEGKVGAVGLRKIQKTTLWTCCRL